MRASSETELQLTFTHEPDEAELRDACAFFNRLEQATLEQYPGFTRVTGDPRRSCTFLARRDGEVVCSAQILERTARGFAFAEIPFGPLFAETETAVESLQAIHNHYTGRGFARLTISLGLPAGPEAEPIETRLRRLPHARTATDEQTWSSLRIDLSPKPEELLRRMSKGHRSGIKRALREGLTVRAAQGTDEVDAFAALLLKMYAARGHTVDGNRTAQSVQETVAFLDRTGLGELLLVTDPAQRLLGGVIVGRQGYTARYYKGAADPDVRHLAVLHPAIFEAMKRAKDRGLAWFDLWGYNHHVDQNDQRHQINRFKKGFGGQFVSYPRPVDCSLGLRGRAYQSLSRLKGWLARS